MKVSLKGFTGFAGYRMGAIDGEIGIIKEVYFDDESWTVRYLIVKAGNWLDGKLTLISPQALLSPDWDNELFPTNLTIDQIKNGPDIDTDKPLYRQQEMKLYDHFPWNIYWGLGMLPLDDSVELAMVSKNQEEEDAADPHLRSSDKVASYRVFAVDSELGTIEDFVIDTDSWKITFMVVKLGNWFSDRKVLVPIEWVLSLDWLNSQVNVNAGSEDVKNCPEFDPNEPVNEVYEKVLRDYYGRKF